MAEKTISSLSFFFTGDSSQNLICTSVESMYILLPSIYFSILYIINRYIPIITIHCVTGLFLLYESCLLSLRVRDLLETVTPPGRTLKFHLIAMTVRTTGSK